MTAADALAKELTELQSFLHDQRKYSSGPRFEEMLQQHALVMVGKAAGDSVVSTHRPAVHEQDQ